MNKRNKRVDFLNACYNAGVNDGSRTVITEILEKESLLKKDRFDGRNSIKNFKASVDAYGRLMLQHKCSGKAYALTDTAWSQLVTKLSYKLALSASLPTDVQNFILERHNRRSNATKLVYTRVDQLGWSLSKTLKGLRTEMVLRTINGLIEISPVAKESHQFKYQLIDGTPSIRSILDLKYKNFDNTELLSELESYFSNNSPDWRVVRYYSDVNGDQFRLRITKAFDKKATNVGEPVEFSLDFKNSETGLSSVSGLVGLYVLKCTNGMRGLGDNAKFELVHNRSDQNAFKNALTKLLSEAEVIWTRMADRYFSSKEIVVPNAELLIKSVCRDYSLGQAVSKRILETYRREGHNSLYNVADAFTEVAHKAYAFNQDGFHKLESIGSQLLFNDDVLAQYGVE